MSSRWLPYAVLAGVDAVLAQRGARRLRRITKPLLMPVLAATAFTGGAAERRVRGAAVVALAGATVGDIALLGKSERAFLGGIAGFLVAHGGWLAACAGLPGDGGAIRRRPRLIAPFAAVYALAAVVLAPRVGRRLSGPVLGYAAVLTAMGVVAVDASARLPAHRGRAVVAGAGLFLLSDAVLAANRFVRPLPGAEATVMLTYTAGQALLAAGLLDVDDPGVDDLGVDEEN